jgi:hypothetical protein
MLFLNASSSFFRSGFLSKYVLVNCSWMDVQLSVSSEYSSSQLYGSGTLTSPLVSLLYVSTWSERWVGGYVLGTQGVGDMDLEEKRARTLRKRSLTGCNRRCMELGFETVF